MKTRMYKPIFKKVLFKKRGFTLWWFLGIAAMTCFTMLFFHSFSSGVFDSSFKNLPEAVQKTVGNAESFKTVSGYISQQIFELRIPMLAIVLTIGLFHGLSVGLEQQGITETELTLPMDRKRLLIGRVLAGLAISTITICGASAGVLIGLLTIKESFSFTTLLTINLQCLLIALVFGLFGFMLGAITGKRSFSLGAASAFAFGCFLVNSMSTSVSAFKEIDKLLPFHYYTTSGDFYLVNTIILLVYCLVPVVVAMVGFSRRDIQLR